VPKGKTVDRKGKKRTQVGRQRTKVMLKGGGGLVAEQIGATNRRGKRLRHRGGDTSALREILLVGDWGSTFAKERLGQGDEEEERDKF